MNKKQLFLCFMVIVKTVCTASTPQKLPQSQDSQEQQLSAFFSLFPDPFTTYPTFTELDSGITLIFEKTFELPDTILNPIKRYYAYLKQQAAQEYIQNTPTVFAQASKVQQAQEKLEIAQTNNDMVDITAQGKIITTLTALINTAIEADVAPQSIKLCRQTASWQNHLKVFIANSYAYETELLGTINQDEIKMFNYLPQFETAYYTSGYTNIRNSAEYVRMFLVMTDTLRQRALAQCTDWSTITSPLDLYTAIESFKASDFYTLSQKLDSYMSGSATQTTPLLHFSFTTPPASTGYSVSKGYTDYLIGAKGPQNTFTITARPGLDSLFSIKNNQPSLTPLGSFLLTEGTITPPKSTPYYGLIPTAPFLKLFTENEAGIGYVPTKLFMDLISFNGIRLINTLLAPLFNTENLAATLHNIHELQINNPSFNYAMFPNPLFYQPEDQLFLEDINALTSLVVTNPNATTPGAAPEGFWDNLWSDIEHAFETLSHTLKSGFEKVGSDIWHAVRAAGNIFVHLAYAVEDIGIGLYYQTGLSALCTGSFEYDGAAAAGYFDAAGTQIHEAGNSLITVVNSVADIAQQVVNMAGGIATVVIAGMDPSLGNSLENCFDQIGALAIGIIRDGTDFLISSGTSLVALAFEAIVLLEEAVVAVLTAGQSGGFSNVAETGVFFAKDLVVSILEAVTLFINMFSDALKTLMQAIGYLVAAITNLVVIIGGAIMGLESMAAGGSFWSGYNEVGQHTRLISAIVGLVLMAAITLATLGTGGPVMLTIGITMLVLGTAMMAIGVVGANQQDMQAISQTEAQTAFVTTFSAYVQASIPANYALQAEMLNEVTMRLEENEKNSDRDLVYYQNYMNSTLNTLRSTQAYQLGAFYNELLTPDTENYPPKGLVPADPGYLYGIQTHRFELNPSTGFRVYNLQRGTFAQEIATIPAPFADPNSTSTESAPLFTVGAQTATSAGPTTNQHFITQKDICNTSLEPLTIQIRWRMIYPSGGDFYIGIYINNNYLDTDFILALNNNFETASQQRGTISQQQFLAAWNPLNTFNRYLYNFDNLSKAFVCYQNQTTANTPALGLYEHSDLQFIVANSQPTGGQNANSWFKQGTWYLMQATLNGNQLSASFTEENSPLIWNGKATVTPPTAESTIPYATLYEQSNYQQTVFANYSFGVITSGAAVEYEIISPKLPTALTPQRVASDTATVNLLTQNGYQPVELTREQSWLSTVNQNLTPQFANWKLIPACSNIPLCGDLLIAQAMYVYETQSTLIKDKNQNSLNDFVVTVATPPPATPIATVGQSLIGYTIGQPFTPQTLYVVSLVTGNLYNNQGQFQQIAYPDALAAYQTIVQLPPAVTAAINQSRQAYYSTEEEGVAFQNVSVTAVESALTRDIYIYSCPSFTQYLSGLDYLVFVQYPTANGGLGTTQPLIPYSSGNSINSALSLVTGLLYNINNTAGNQVTALPQPTSVTNQNWLNLTIAPSGGGAFSNPLSTYQSNISTTLATTIQKQTTVYNAAVAAAAALAAKQIPIQPPILPVQQPITPPPPVPAGPVNLQTLMFGSTTPPNNGGFSFTG